MQQEFTKYSTIESHTTGSQPSSSPPIQHGFHRDRSGAQSDYGGVSPDSLRPNASPGSAQAIDTDSPGSSSGRINANELDEELRGLSLLSRQPDSGRSSTVAGQRILEYENALAPASPRKGGLGFRIIRRSGIPSGGTQLTDFPNEVLTHILSHLHPDSHSAVALVSKRFYSLITEPHAWRMAFVRYFPAHESLAVSTKQPAQGSDKAETGDTIRTEHRSFARLTNKASWRSEYLLRTRLLRSLARGKPGMGTVGAPSTRLVPSGKKAGAVLTYNSKLPWTVGNIHAVFSASGKRGPRAIHGSGHLGVGTISDPTNGRLEKWGLDDPFSFAQLDEVFPDLEPFGLGDGPAAMPNSIDVSQPYGLVGGEGFPGGRAYFRGTGELRGRYLGGDTGLMDLGPEFPKIPELSEAITAVWIARSPSVPSVTQSMVGIMTGSSLGIVTAYALGYDISGPGYSNGDITARWVLSPGVPIISLQVDGNYSLKRKGMKRVWAVALNALGEVFYLKDTPRPVSDRARGADGVKLAWLAGRTAFWDMVDGTRRRARPDEFDKNAVRGAYSPRSPADSMQLSNAQLVAEAREIEKFLRHKPAHFRRVCQGWDMLRKLEVDFAGDNENGTGENIVVICNGHQKGGQCDISRLTRQHCNPAAQEGASAGRGPPAHLQPTGASIFGWNDSSKSVLPTTPAPPSSNPSLSPRSTSPHDVPSSTSTAIDDWGLTKLSLNEFATGQISASALDGSTYALLASFEDQMLSAGQNAPSSPAVIPKEYASGDIPGRRARFLAIGTKTGVVVVWNLREAASRGEVPPVRIIGTESPEISSLALSALYLIHGGSDGLVQAWDPLASTLDPIRTLNARSSGRIPRHIVNANPALRDANFSAVGAIYIDPDATVLRGLLSFGTFLRYWSYSSTGQQASRKRRSRHSDVHGRLVSRRQGGTVQGYIAAEEAELRREQEHRRREQARLQSRFGVGLGDLTEEEAIRYAQMMSEESFQQDEQRRTSASDTGSAADMGETSSATGSFDTVTPDPSVVGLSPPAPRAGPSAAMQSDTGDDYELQIQQALRLSLMEGVNDVGQSPRDNSSGEYDVHIKYGGSSNKGTRSASASPPESYPDTPLVQETGSSARPGSSSPDALLDEDLELALKLSLEEEQKRLSREAGLDTSEDDFPSLEGRGKGKGKRA